MHGLVFNQDKTTHHLLDHIVTKFLAPPLKVARTLKIAGLKFAEQLLGSLIKQAHFNSIQVIFQHSQLTYCIPFVKKFEG